MSRLLLALWIAAIALHATVQAQKQFPSRQVTIVVPYPGGGSNDLFARELGRRLSEAWKVPVLVDNRPGSDSAGAVLVSKASADGHTLLFVSSSFATNAALQPKLPFDPIKGFTPIGMVAKGPMILTLTPSVPMRSLTELLAYARAHPGQLTYGSSGVGSNNHFAAEMLEEAAGVQMKHVPYRGMGPAIADVIAGRADLVIASVPSIGEDVKTGRVRGLAVTSPVPSPFFPGLPAIAQRGVPGYSFELWWALLAPADLPDEIAVKINTDLNRILATPEMKKVFLREGAHAAMTTPSELGATIRSEIEGWRRVAARAGIKRE
jgi:tripartite-type tricarboxylate transporter receptor subunit TctC